MKVLKPLIQQLTQAIKEGYDLGKRELPKIASEILRYSFLSAMVTFTTQLAIALIFACYMMHTAFTLRGEAAFICGLGGMVSGGVTIGVITELLDTTRELFKIKLAPRVYLLETLRDYIN